jgi:Domain of unknown function (DUF1985)
MAEKQFLVPVADHYPGRVTWKCNLDKVLNKFKEMELIDRVKQTQFKHLFNAPQIKFSGILIHEMLLRKTGSNQNEIHFFVNSPLTFGIKEFALITGLRFGNFPEEVVDGSVPRLVRDYFPKEERVEMHQLESIFLSCADQVDAWKLGLVYLVCHYLFAYEAKKPIDFKMFHMVEKNEDKFLDYPWGKVSFRETLKGVNKDMKHLRNLYLQKKDKYDKSMEDYKKMSKAEKKEAKRVNAPEAQYTLYGLAIAFQIWCYEVIVPFVPRFATKMKFEVPADNIRPRIMMYTATKRNTAIDIAKILNMKNVSIVRYSSSYVRYSSS